MKSLLYLFLAGVLAIAPAGCNREDETSTAAAPDSTGAGNDQAVQPAAPARPSGEYAPRPATPSTRDSRPAGEAAPREEAPRLDRPADKAPAAPAKTAAVQSVRVPEGTSMTVALLDAVGTEISSEGETFSAHLTAPLSVNGRVVAESGSRVTGKVQNIEEPGKVKGRATLELVLTSITAGGKNYRVESEPFVATGDDSKERDAAVIGGGAGVGAIIGGIAGGKKGAAIGAAVGGGSGTAAVLMTKGKQLRLEPETKVNFVLKEDVTLPVVRRVIS